jgi:hypothetical protein
MSRNIIFVPDIMVLPAYIGSWDSVVSIATRYGLDDRGIGVRVLVGSRIFSFPRRPYRLWGPLNLYLMGTGVSLSSRLKRPGRESDHSPTASAEVKKMWIYTSTPPYAFMAYGLISYAQGQLYLYFYRCA